MWIEVFYLDLHDKISSFVAPGVVTAIVKEYKKRRTITREDKRNLF